MNWSFQYLYLTLLACLLSASALKAQLEEVPKANPDASIARQRTGVGTYYGRIDTVREDYTALQVRPISRVPGRRRFYLDEKTQIRDGAKAVSASILTPGKVVAIRYFQEKDIAVAHRIQLVSGELLAICETVSDSSSCRFSYQVSK